MQKLNQLPTKYRITIGVVLLAIIVLVILLLNNTFSQALNLIFPNKVEYIAAPSHTTMQTFNNDDCNAMPLYTTLELEDSRGNNQHYRIRKMPDNHCWMIDNLKLAAGTTLDASNTNLDGTEPADFASTWSTITAPVQATASHSNGKCTNDSTATLANGSGYLTCDGTAYTDDNDGFIAYSDPAGTGNSYYENCVAGTYNGTNEESLTGCGYLYNWYTATAGTGNYQKGSGTNATASICPAGWHMPYNTATNDFGVLNASMKNNTPSASSTASDATTHPNWFYNGPFEGSLSGIYSASLANVGTNGYYWSARTSSDDRLAYGLLFLYSAVNPGISDTRANGYALRCIL
ncbi:hypothetical protein FACS189431_2220 [Alphaproteobacteria bacterium]|nr:hypothetical protein FACS189431_2220 [Alphaproteobacteria bacterium]